MNASSKSGSDGRTGHGAGRETRSSPDPGLLSIHDPRRLHVPDGLSPTNLRCYWDERDEGATHAAALAKARRWQAEMSTDERREDWEKQPTSAVPVAPGDAFARVFPGLEPNFAREPQWRAASWRAPPPSERLSIDEFIGSSVAARPPKGLTIGWMAERYLESAEFVQDVDVGVARWRDDIEVWRLQTQRKTVPEVWRLQTQRKTVPVGERPLDAAGEVWREAFREAFRARRYWRRAETELRPKTLRALFRWGYRRGLWSTHDPKASRWLDRAGLVERGVRDPYCKARWGIVSAAYGASFAADESARERQEKRNLLVELKKMAEGAAKRLQPPDLAPFPRQPSQITGPDQIASDLRRADHNLSEIVLISEEMLENFDATSRLLDKKDERRNVWAREFIRSLARVYAHLTGERPTGSKQEFISFVEACYRSIRPDCGAVSFDHQVKSALGGPRKPRARPKWPDKRKEP
jgi:hypothetical protein